MAPFLSAERQSGLLALLALLLALVSAQGRAFPQSRELWMSNRKQALTQYVQPDYTSKKVKALSICLAFTANTTIDYDNLAATTTATYESGVIYDCETSEVLGSHSEYCVSDTAVQFQVDCDVGLMFNDDTNSAIFFHFMYGPVGDSLILLGTNGKFGTKETLKVGYFPSTFQFSAPDVFEDYGYGITIAYNKGRGWNPVSYQSISVTKNSKVVSQAETIASANSEAVASVASDTACIFDMDGTLRGCKAGLNSNNADCAKTYCECGACSSSQADGNLWGPGALEVVKQCLKDGHIVGIASFNNLKNVLNFFKLAAPELLKKYWTCNGGLVTGYSEFGCTAGGSRPAGQLQIRAAGSYKDFNYPATDYCKAVSNSCDTAARGRSDKAGMIKSIFTANGGLKKAVYFDDCGKNIDYLKKPGQFNFPGHTVTYNTRKFCVNAEKVVAIHDSDTKGGVTKTIYDNAIAALNTAGYCT